MKTNRLPHMIVPGAICVAALLLTGCGSESSSEASFDTISGDLTPGMKTLGERPEDVSGHMAYTFNHENRMFWGDIGRAWYVDHPTRLSPYPIISTTGVPR
ncbi:MAG: hypothetical protein GY715_19620 [Planctomycetes bacterium]|nr:hypothetical protein [Planctomycetota bacterium]